MNKKIYCWKKLLIFTLILTFVFTLTACGKNAPGHTEQLAVEDEVKATQFIKENVVRVVNTVGNNKIVGTGFFIKEGYLLTNSHIIDIEGTVSIEYYDGTNSTAKIYSNSIEKDVALLTVSNKKTVPLTLGSTNNLDITDTVLAVGYAYNLGGEASTTKGTLSARRAFSEINYLQSDISMNSGFSGGPLFNSLAEVVGLNTFASENGNMGIAISSESLKQIIKTLIDSPSVNYLTGTRPANALSEMLVEIGFNAEEDDIFNEEYILESIKSQGTKDNTNNETDKEHVSAPTQDEDNTAADNQEEDKTDSSNENSNNNAQTPIENKKRSDATIKSLSIEGYTVEVRDSTTYSTIVKQTNELPIDIVMNDKNAKYVISGNSSFKEGKNSVIITTEAEDGTKIEYTLIVYVPLSEIPGATKIIAGLDIINNGGCNCFNIHWDYADRDGVRIYPSAPTDIISNISITISAGWEGWVGTVLRPLKTYTYTEFNYGQQRINDIKLDDIRILLTDEEYEGGAYSGADLTIDITITTKNNGVFTARLPWGLPK